MCENGYQKKALMINFKRKLLDEVDKGRMHTDAVSVTFVVRFDSGDLLQQLTD